MFHNNAILTHAVKFPQISNIFITSYTSTTNDSNLFTSADPLNQDQEHLDQ